MQSGTQMKHYKVSRTGSNVNQWFMHVAERTDSRAT